LVQKEVEVMSLILESFISVAYDYCIILGSKDFFYAKQKFAKKGIG
jgi:hypothetical protein